MKAAILFLLTIGLIAGGAGYYATHLSDAPTTSFRTATIKRGDVLATIGATGTVEPEDLVDVGAQVAGKISSLGSDPQHPKKTVDYNSVVKQGTVLAMIDDSVYQAQVDQARALLLRSQADLTQAQAKLEQAEQEWKRAEELLPSQAIAGTDYDLARANRRAAEATVNVSKATIKQNEAALRLAETNLGYTTIKSPVDGTIIDRRVNVGQTVVASLNAPSLFLIAKDLRRMQVWAQVNEADIGNIHPDMPVHFTVDAYPGETFYGKVAQVRMNANTTQNVVIYTVVVATDNADLKLFPYLTANVQFEIDRRENVFQVPNVALRWRPPRPELIAPEARQQAASPAKGGGVEGRARRGSPGDAPAAKSPKGREERGRVWIKEGSFVRPLDVKVGVTDGSVTEISGDGIEEGLEVVTGEVRAEQAVAETTNPFAPKFLRGGSKPRSN
jgi:HlyD family secretion protein